MNQRMESAPRFPSGLTLVIAALLPGVAWMAVLAVGSQLDEDVCSTGAVPHRGQWFGASVRLPLLIMAGAAVASSVAAAVVLLRGWRAARDVSGRVAEMRTFISLIGLVSLGLFVPILAATFVELVVMRRC